MRIAIWVSGKSSDEIGFCYSITFDFVDGIKLLNLYMTSCQINSNKRIFGALSFGILNYT